jgi:hypothetical protein
MPNDDEQTTQPSLRVVSGNPDAPDRRGREVIRAKAQAQHALSRLAATMLRTIAGSESESYDLTQRIGDYMEAQTELHAISGDWLTIQEERDALGLPTAEYPLGCSDFQKREWLRNQGMKRIIQGALRLAAHGLLGEKPHFGGRYSERLIRQGIDSMARAREPAAPPRPSGKAPQEQTVFRATREPKGRRKRWSARDSRSYRDPPSDNES